jgi:deaminated glutathione amidase
VSPSGEVLAELGPSPGLLFVDCEIEVIDQARATIPVLANRRF